MIETDRAFSESIPVETIRSATSDYFQPHRPFVKHIQTVLPRQFVYTSALMGTR